MSDPAVDAARRAMKHDPHQGVSLYDIAEIRVNAAREMAKPIRKKHRPIDDYGDGILHCLTCSPVRWPCDTAKLIYTSEELR